MPTGLVVALFLGYAVFMGIYYVQGEKKKQHLLKIMKPPSAAGREARLRQLPWIHRIYRAQSFCVNVFLLGFLPGSILFFYLGVKQFKSVYPLAIFVLVWVMLYLFVDSCILRRMWRCPGCGEKLPVKNGGRIRVPWLCETCIHCCYAFLEDSPDI